MAILELKDVTKKFGGLTAVDGVNLKVEENQICALIGPNGAGKTTVFNMITGAYQVTSGDVIFNGKSICGKKPHQIVENGIARTFQNIRLFKSATVLENVMTGFHCKTKTGMFNVIFNYRKCMQEEAECREKALEILRFLGLEDVKDLEARNIPYGHQRLLEIGRALATSPKLLLLDEPAAGMNSQEKKELVNTIRKIRDTYHLAVLLVEHDMELVMGISENITVINFGRPIACGTAEEIQNNNDVIEAYLVHIDEGSILYKGQELVGKKSHEIVPMGISLVPEGRKIFIELSVEKNLEIGTFFRKRTPERDKELLDMVYKVFPRLYERRNQLGGTLSGGEQQMLAVGRAIMSDPELLMLDEPSMGLAPLVIAEVFQVIKKVNEMGITVLLVEQNAKQALKISDRAYLMNTGKIVVAGTGDDFLKGDVLTSVYLGGKKE